MVQERLLKSDVWLNKSILRQINTSESAQEASQWVITVHQRMNSTVSFCHMFYRVCWLVSSGPGFWWSDSNVSHHMFPAKVLQGFFFFQEARLLTEQDNPPNSLPRCYKARHKTLNSSTGAARWLLIKKSTGIFWKLYGEKQRDRRKWIPAVLLLKKKKSHWTEPSSESSTEVRRAPPLRHSVTT